MKSPVYFPSLSLESCSVIFLPEEFSILDLEPQMWDIRKGKKIFSSFVINPLVKQVEMGERNC